MRTSVRSATRSFLHVAHCVFIGTLIHVGCGKDGYSDQSTTQVLYVDIIDYARITATDTYRSFLGLWPRETDDAPYTIRDKDLKTSWKVPRSGTNTLRIDFAPLLSAAPLVSRLEPLWERAPKSPLSVRLLDYCGGERVFEDYRIDPTHPYHLDEPVHCSCIEIDVPGSPEHVRLSELHVYAVIQHMLDTPDRDDLFWKDLGWNMSPKSYAAQCGVVEGFYGTPWSHRERLAMIERLGQVGLGLYIYAPKNDPLHRDQWRVPYDDTFIQRFSELNDVGQRLGVTVSLGISPGKDMITADREERDLLVAKLRPFIDLGIRHITLLFDDIESDVGVPIDNRLGQAHAELANWLLSTLESLAHAEIALWVVPTVYSSDRHYRWPGGTAYLSALNALHPRIQVMWTGTDTLSPTLGASDLREVTEIIGRKPVIWENQHATDGGDGFVGKVYLAPYMRRSPDLVEATQGILANPMILGAASRLIIPTYAWFIADPFGYQYENALERAVALEASNEADRSLLRLVCSTFYGSGVLGVPGINLPTNPAMERAINDVCAMLARGSTKGLIRAGFNLLTIAAEMATVQTRMYHSQLEVSLVDDLWFPADRLTHEGYALLWLLSWLGSVLNGAPDEEALVQADRYLKKALLDRYQLSLFKVNSFRDFILRHQPTNIGFDPPVIEPPLLQPRIAMEWEYTPCTEAKVAVYGLPGSHVEDSTITWTPLHPGMYEAVVLARTEKGWSWRQIELVVSR